MKDAGWCVAVFKCKSDRARDVLVDFYSFVDGMFGVKDLHFLVRDRLDDEVVFSFRIQAERENMNVVKSKIRYSLRRLVSKGGISINPRRGSPLYEYTAWHPEERIAKFGEAKFSMFCRFLSQFSRAVIDMANCGYFSSEERIELAHVASWMLGCTEYGSLSTKSMQIGYYDRIEGKAHAYLTQNFED